MKRLSGAVRETERIACRVAPLNCSVMILGPNGSGKESVAQLIQQHSGRKDKPFVAVNCGCIRGELAASEFFGHVQGAFTDAKKDTAGYFETAKGGTLFLDEIGNMPPEMQTLLLRVLQERVYCPVGSRKELEADVRILSATNEDMERAIREGRFREDLYYRLAEFEIRQPLSPNARKIYCHWLTSFVSNIQKRYVWRPPVLPNKPKSPCFPTHGRAMCVNLTTG